MHAEITPGNFANYQLRGLLMAAAVMGGWASVVVAGLGGWYPGAGFVVVDGAWVLIEAFAYTGLFITAHDAMHGLVAPRFPRLNHAIGTLAIGLFAAMPYAKLREAHGVHHRAPSTDEDPDYHEKPGSVLTWYLRFCWAYASWRQVLTMALVFNILHHGLGLGLFQLWVFWIAPQILSTIQLFVFGTWLPHREGPFEGVGPTKTRSQGYPTWLSLLTCFHFGYHYEHHAWPFVPWWRLPKARGLRLRELQASPAGGLDAPVKSMNG